MRLRMAITGGRDCLPRPGGENRARCLTTTQPRKWRSSRTAIAVTNYVAETAPTPSAAAFPPQDVIEVHESPARRALQCEASRASEAGRLPREDREGKLPCLKAVPSAAETVAGVGWPELTSSNSMQKPSAVRGVFQRRPRPPRAFSSSCEGGISRAGQRQDCAAESCCAGCEYGQAEKPKPLM